MWYSSHCTVQFSSFLCWVPWILIRATLWYSPSRCRLMQAYLFGLMCFCLVVSRPWASFSLIKDFFSSMTSFAYSDARGVTRVWDVGKNLYFLNSNPCLSEKEYLPLASFLAIPFLRGSFLWAAASYSWIVDWYDPEFTLVLWVI